MTPEAQQKAVLTALGWTDIGLYSADQFGDDEPEYVLAGLNPKAQGIGGMGALDKAPNFLEDLNAVREARKVLTKDEQNRFVGYLENIVARQPGANLWTWALIDSTPEQQTEAFLRAKNLWIN